MLILQEIAKPVDWQEHLRALFQTVTAQGMCQDMHLLVYLQDKLVVPFQTAIAAEMYQEAVLLGDLREIKGIHQKFHMFHFYLFFFAVILAQLTGKIWLGI